MRLKRDERIISFPLLKKRNQEVTAEEKRKEKRKGV